MLYNFFLAMPYEWNPRFRLKIILTKSLKWGSQGVVLWCETENMHVQIFWNFSPYVNITFKHEFQTTVLLSLRTWSHNPGTSMCHKLYKVSFFLPLHKTFSLDISSCQIQSVFHFCHYMYERQILALHLGSF